VRSDGSWPIDTNLATWVTTLSVRALGDRLPSHEREAIRDWLLGQQYKTVHPYTGAAPGGWAWTDLSGGVPDADDTAGALLALERLGPKDGRVAVAALSGVEWLLNLQNSDGGLPAFCRGWGKLPFDRSSPDITAHALLAWFRWQPAMNAPMREQVKAAIARALAFLERTQRSDGAWVPLWFGNQFAGNEENAVYGTSRVLLALNQVQPASFMANRAANWLLAAQNQDGGWGGDQGLPPTIEETAVAVAALAEAAGNRIRESVLRESALRGTDWLVKASSGGEETSPSPIGLYFASLWYYERLYPLIFAADALRRSQ
ncbi:MAG: prenyltransferase/squalene oxidase repeat-containing protein, partial [Bryobacteraceae bacterium]